MCTDKPPSYFLVLGELITIGFQHDLVFYGVPVFYRIGFTSAEFLSLPRSFGQSDLLHEIGVRDPFLRLSVGLGREPLLFIYGKFGGIEV